MVLSVTSTVLLVFHPGLVLWNLFTHISCSVIDLLSCARMWFLHGWLVKTWNKYLQWKRSGERNTVCRILWFMGKLEDSLEKRGVSLCVFLYFSSHLYSLSLPMLFSDFRSQFHSQPYFLSFHLILYPTIHSFYPMMVFFYPFLPILFRALLFSQVNPNMTKVCTSL